VAYLEAHALTVVTTLASIVFAVRLLGSRRSSQSIIAWLLGVVFAPLVAIPLYLLFGARKFPRRAKTSSRVALANAGADPSSLEIGMTRLLTASGVAPPRDHSSFELLSTGEAAYARLLSLIRDAKRSIDLTMFIVGDDATGRAIVDALAARARDGVAVRVVLDAVGCTRTRRHAARVIDAAGGEVRVFMPLWHSPIRGRTNLRNHRKLAVFDGERVFAGGMNLATEYMGPTKMESRWVDVAAVVSGPVASDASRLFESDWVYCGGAQRAPLAPPPRAGDERVQVVPSGPDMTSDTVYDVFLDAIYGARERVAIVTPYYVPDDSLQHALVVAARRGVEVDLVVPSRSNHAIADVARRPLVRELAGAGAHLRFYAHGMVHAKAMVVDDSFAYIGSPNFDMRSLFLNYEVALCLYSAGAIGQVRAFVDALAAKCTDEAPRARELWLLERAASLLAPEL
jgi:cardiolipin synthase